MERESAMELPLYGVAASLAGPLYRCALSSRLPERNRCRSGAGVWLQLQRSCRHVASLLQAHLRLLPSPFRPIQGRPLVRFSL